MLISIFMRLLDMTRMASIAIVAVLLARLLLKRLPKAVSYALWAVVLFRLLCPLSIEVAVSIMPEITPTEAAYTLADVPITPASAFEAAYGAMGDALNGGLGIQHIRTELPVEEGANVSVVTSAWWEVWILLGQYVWLAGVLAMAVYAAVSYLRLRRKLLVAMPLRDNIWIADAITSPFVMGLLRPKIYLPSSTDEREREYIILHEQYHIRRGDHIIKALAFLALCIHWFNPLVWAAFIAAGKDMEMSCDEAVVRRMGDGILADYTASLLSLATGRRIIAGMPLAFGEGDPKSRIRHLANWKKPALWVIAAGAAACAVLAAMLLTNPKTGNYLMLTQWDNTLGNHVQYALKLDRPAMAGQVVAEHWQNGKCVDTATLAVDQTNTTLDVCVRPHREDNVLTGMDIQLEKSGQSMAVLAFFPLGQREESVGWAFTACEQGERVALSRESETVLAALNYDFGSGVLSLSCASLTQEPQRLTEAEEAIVVRLKWDAPPAVQTVSKTLTLDDVIALSAKGESLTWDDFASYKSIETGSGLYIRYYEIDQQYCLLIGGVPNENPPMYIRLYANYGTSDEDEIDIRTQSVTDFLEKRARDGLIAEPIAPAEASDDTAPDIAPSDAPTPAEPPFNDGEIINGIMRAYSPSVFAEGSPNGISVTVTNDWSLDAMASAIKAALHARLQGTLLENDLVRVEIASSFSLPPQYGAGTVLSVPYFAYYEDEPQKLPSGADFIPSGKTGELTARVTLAGQGSIDLDADFTAAQERYAQLAACAQLEPLVFKVGTSEDLHEVVRARIEDKLNASPVGALYQLGSTWGGECYTLAWLSSGFEGDYEFGMTFVPKDAASGVEDVSINTLVHYSVK